MKCKSILIAEDNRDVRETLVEALEGEGYIVVGAKNGRDALDLLESMPAPTLILLDLMMPVMSGWEFLDAQKKDARFAAHQVVTISAMSATQSLEVTSPLDVAGSLQKPLSLNRVWKTVQQFCESPVVAQLA